MGTVAMRHGGGGCGGSLTWNKEYLLKNCPSIRSSTSVIFKPITNFCDNTQFKYPHCRFNTFCCLTKLLLHLVAEICVYMWYDIPILIRCIEKIRVIPVFVKVSCINGKVWLGDNWLPRYLYINAFEIERFE